MGARDSCAPSVVLLAISRDNLNGITCCARFFPIKQVFYTMFIPVSIFERLESTKLIIQKSLSTCSFVCWLKSFEKLYWRLKIEYSSLSVDHEANFLIVCANLLSFHLYNFSHYLVVTMLLYRLKSTFDCGDRFPILKVLNNSTKRPKNWKFQFRKIDFRLFKVHFQNRYLICS